MERCRWSLRSGRRSSPGARCASNTSTHAAEPGPISPLLTCVFGKDGVHARSAVGFSSLPFGMPVELEAVFELH
jgi:enamine deaminase RidA (YjgF/YER057c/UK114 family)